MLDFLQKSVFWWAICGVFTVLFVIASVPRPSLEAVPWLVFAVAAAGMALAPNGSVTALWDIFYRLAWVDVAMRWHLVAALLLSVGATFLSIGMTGFLPVVVTGVVFHPTDAVSFLRQLNMAALGDGAWPSMILSGFLWPWALPTAYALIAHTAAAALAAGWRWGLYAVIVVVWWVAQSIAVSFATFGRNVFAP